MGPRAPVASASLGSRWSLHDSLTGGGEAASFGETAAIPEWGHELSAHLNVDNRAEEAAAVRLEDDLKDPPLEVQGDIPIGGGFADSLLLQQLHIN